MKKILLLLFFIQCFVSEAQQLYVSEKMYLQTDRSQYIAGDTQFGLRLTIWMLVRTP
jgi:hypothetical protein